MCILGIIQLFSFKVRLIHVSIWVMATDNTMTEFTQGGKGYAGLAATKHQRLWFLFITNMPFAFY